MSLLVKCGVELKDLIRANYLVASGPRGWNYM
jgi:hypothetical protein